jgi:hypothetical protein
VPPYTTLRKNSVLVRADGCGALTDGGPIVSYGGYKAPWHVLVAAGDGDVAVVMLSLERHCI